MLAGFSRLLLPAFVQGLFSEFIGLNNLLWMDERRSSPASRLISIDLPSRIWWTAPKKNPPEIRIGVQPTNRIYGQQWLPPCGATTATCVRPGEEGGKQGETLLQEQCPYMFASGAASTGLTGGRTQIYSSIEWSAK
jgi:hypothetical protein